VKILLVGGGGREHALAWAIRRELPAAELFCAPGNAGTGLLATNLPIGAESLPEILAAVDQRRIDLTVVGPEAPLALGLADLLRVRGYRVFGPNQAAARIESSKAWAKDVMTAAGIPTAASRTFTDFAEARSYIDRHPEPLVVKASGLAAGKGAIVCATRAEAIAAARSMLAEGGFGEAGSVVVVESFLVGEELSVLAVAHGQEFRLLPAAQDHKRLLDGDRGPNTGGMGAYSPVALETPELLTRVSERVIAPALAELARRNAPFSGVLYAGLMIDDAGNPWVVEFNCRFGDPETQVILPRLASGLVGSLWAAATGEPLPAIETSSDAAVTTVLAARGYPDRPEKGAPIRVPDDLPAGALVFHAGTARDSAGRVVVSGGRVLAVTGVAPTFGAAQAVSRAGAEMIEFEGKQFRRDIGWREAGRVSSV
jgi:phosphoribosylamine--glycine ligase